MVFSRVRLVFFHENIGSFIQDDTDFLKVSCTSKMYFIGDVANFGLEGGPEISGISHEARNSKLDMKCGIFPTIGGKFSHENIYDFIQDDAVLLNVSCIPKIHLVGNITDFGLEDGQGILKISNGARN